MRQLCCLISNSHATVNTQRFDIVCTLVPICTVATAVKAMYQHCSTACLLFVFWARPIQSRPYQPSPLRSILILSPIYFVSQEVSFPQAPRQNPVCTSPLPHTCYTPRWCHSSQSDYFQLHKLTLISWCQYCTFCKILATLNCVLQDEELALIRNLQTAVLVAWH
jgi:hypothetical protein